MIAGRRERGVALVTAMFVVAIVATLATSLAVSQQVWLRQAQNMADLGQADGISRGAIQLAGLLLMHDARETKIDDLTEVWNKPFPPLPVEGGFVTIQLKDAQGRFNLNNLVTTSDTPNTDEIQVFRNLLTELELATGLADALVDWIDGNSNVSADGAEDLDYINLPMPYRAANTRLETVDELKRIKGFTPEVVDKLRPYVVALPEITKINLNTAEPEVLSALTGMSVSALKPILDARNNTPFTDAKQFDDQVRAPQPIKAGREVLTKYFIVTIETSVGRIMRRTEALLFRDGSTKPPTALWQQPVRWQIEPSKPDDT